MTKTDFNVENNYTEIERARALREVVGGFLTDIVEEGAGNYFSVGGDEFLVLTNEEADKICKEYVEEEFDDVFEISCHATVAFGRGDIVAKHDGEESKAIDPITEEVYFVYQIA